MTNLTAVDNLAGGPTGTGGRAITVRAVVIGLTLGTAIAALGYFNDWVLNQPYVAADLAPVSVYGLLIVGLLGVNPLLRLLRIRPLTTGEWCVVVGMMLAACAIPGPGLMWGFTNPLVMPHHYNDQNPAWRQWRLLQYLPGAMLADAGPGDEVVWKFIEGVGDGRPAAWSAVPWYGWWRTLAFWVPLLGMSFIAAICLAVVVHPQWVHRERLRYPLAEFAGRLIGGPGPAGEGSIFRQRRFWVGFAVSFAVLGLNGFNAWSVQLWNRQVLQIPLWVDLTPLSVRFPRLAGAPYGGVFGPVVWLAPLGLAFLVSTDVSFSIGISSLAWSLVFVGLTEAGVDTSYSYLGGGLLPHAAFGAYVATAVLILYTGRRYYAAVLRGAIGLPAREGVSASTVWACRMGLLCAAGMVVLLLVVLRLHWLPAVLFVLLTGLLFLIVCRISVETGLFFLQPLWHAGGVVLAMFGFPALGPQGLLVLGLLGATMTIDPRVCLMPLAANALRVGESGPVAPGRLGWAMGLAVLVALAAGLIGTLYVQYSYGSASLYGWPDICAQYPFEVLLKELPQTAPADIIEKGAFGWNRIRPSKPFLSAAGVGFAGVVVCSAMRLRLPWWPIHPVLFLVAGTLPSALFWGSFLAGWLAKTAVLRFGGGGAYEKAKQFFIGLVAGEFALGIVSMAAGLACYLLTGLKGPGFRVHP